MGQRKLRVTPELMVDLCKTRQTFHPPQVKCDGLPDDVKLISVRVVEIVSNCQELEFTVASDQWDDSGEYVRPVFTAIVEDVPGDAAC